MDFDNSDLFDNEEFGNPKKRVRKLQHNWTVEQTERLIGAVKKREDTWNFSSRENRDTTLCKALWQEVADEVQLPRSEVTTKWNSLRGSFRASLNRSGAIKIEKGAKKPSAPNQIYKLMQFLEPTLRVEASSTSNLTNANVSASEESTLDVDLSEVEQNTSSPFFSYDMDPNNSDLLTVNPIEVNSAKKRVRKLQQNWTTELTERLIEAVQRREIIWNYSSKENRDRKLREALWQEVADELQLPRSEVSTKWNCLRCSFRASFNRFGATKGVPAVKKPSAPNQVYKLMQFLEPTLRVEASTTSNLAKASLSASEESTCDVDLSDVEQPAPSTSKPSKKRPRSEEDDQYAKVVQQALKTMAAASKGDSWDDWGNYVASSGREFAAEDPILAKQFKIAMNEVVLKYEKMFLSRHNPASKVIQLVKCEYIDGDAIETITDDYPKKNE